MQTLPIGVQDFAQLRERNYIYVDKTQQILALMQVGAFVFLSRPRRFGKSLLTTTLKAIFEGKQELFQGLWIEDKIDWQPRPVILINFNDLNYRDLGCVDISQPAAGNTQQSASHNQRAHCKCQHSLSLADALDNYLDRLATEHALTFVATDYKSKTTLARLLLGMTQPSAGSIQFKGQTLATMNRHDRKDFRRQVQAIFQDPSEGNAWLQICQSLSFCHD